MRYVSKKNAGQITIEAVLILTIFVSLMYTVSRVMQDGQILSKLVERPWGYVSGMIENSIWAPPAAGKTNHPNQISRHGSPQGDAP